LQKLFSFHIYICRRPTLIGKLQEQQQAQKLEGWGEREIAERHILGKARLCLVWER